MYNNVFGLLHLIIHYSSKIGALFYKPLKVLVVFYDECLLLSWIAFKNECLITYLTKKSNKPNLLIAHTVKGKSIKFLENKFESHYHVLNKKEYEISLKGLRG